MMHSDRPRRLIHERTAGDRLGIKSATTMRQQVRSKLLTSPIRLSHGPTSPKLYPEFEIDEIVSARIAGASDDEIRNLVARLEAQRKVAA